MKGGTEKIPHPDEDWLPHNPWVLAGAVMLAPFMQVLDTSIANIALPHIAGNLSVTTDEATWVLTSYLVSSAIILPMTGWLGNYFGRKRLLLWCVALFTLASVVCGAALNLPMLILARVLQGVGGGVMVPIAQAVLLESFPPKKRGIAMALFTQCVVVAPIIGPTLGGWITDNYSWRWVFYINLPIGILSMCLVSWFVKDPPYIKRNKKAAIDFIGFGLLVLWLATLQIVLDKGQEADWFDANWVRWFTGISVAALIGFIAREFTVEHPLVNLRILRNRNFTVGLMLVTVVVAILYGTTVELPLFLQTLMGYPALQSGYALSPRGIGAFVATILVGQLIGRINNRWLMCVGFPVLAMASFMLSDINLQVSEAAVIWPSVINGIAVSFIFVPLTVATMGHLSQTQMGDATGLYNLMRNLGGSIGIAFVTTMIARGAQVHQAMMVKHLTPANPVFAQHLSVLQHALAKRINPVTAANQAYGLIYQTLDRQAHLWAFVDNFTLLGWLALGCIPLLFLFKRVQHSKKPAVVQMD